MMIDIIEILNFGSFYGKHKIEFQSSDPGIIIFRGGNGQGKTSLQRAVIWALYGKVYDRKGQEIPPTSLLNLTALSEDIYKFGVGVFFNHDGGRWAVLRQMKANSHQDKKYIEGMTLNVVKDGEVLADPENVIQRILPSDVSRFYFFDGEMLRDYEELLDEDSRSMFIIRDSIERVLGVPYFKTARDDLVAIQKKIENERNKLIRKLGGKEYEELAECLQTVTAEIEDKETTIEGLIRQISKLEDEIVEKKRRLTDIREVQELAHSQISIEKDISLKKEKKEKALEKMQALVKDLYKELLKPIAKNVISHLTAKSEASLEKYNNKQRAVERVERLKKGILSQKCSLCGTVLEPKKLRQLEEELHETEILIKQLTEIPEPNLTFEHHKTRLEKIISHSNIREDFREIENEIGKIDHELASLQAQLNDIIGKLTGQDKEEPRELEISIQNLKKEQGRLEGLVKVKAEEVLGLKETKAEFEASLASIPKREINILGKRIEFVESVKEVFEEAISSYRDKKKFDIERIATEIFRTIRSKEEFDSLKINEQFGLSIMTKNGTCLSRSEWRSAGEEQIVALALIGALNKSAHVKAPVFMDTPFGRLDIKHGERVLKYLPNLADQVVLLVTDRDFRKGDERYLEGKIKNDFTIIYKSQKEGSRVFATQDLEVAP
ncbi:MAG: AAA family ATPase [Candidatus Methanoperedens sp.]|nr:AAA family ATPase [Candidatus Methanoperedens sp.]MCZ7394282.1 AAA family ATPase [Candidatus Methanoperedens sp.]